MCSNRNSIIENRNVEHRRIEGKCEKLKIYLQVKEMKWKIEKAMNLFCMYVCLTFE